MSIWKIFLDDSKPIPDCERCGETLNTDKAYPTARIDKQTGAAYHPKCWEKEF